MAAMSAHNLVALLVVQWGRTWAALMVGSMAASWADPLVGDWAVPMAVWLEQS